jgi:folate-binding protein YgfZ
VQQQLYNLSELGLLKVSGTQATKLLQGQLTCDVEKITAMQSSLAAHCNPQGRIISLFYLCLFNSDFHLLMPRNMIDIALSALKKYAAFYKTELSDVSNTLSCIGYVGPQIDTKELTRITTPGNDARCIYIGEASVIKLQILDKLTTEISPPEAWKELDITDGIPSLYPATTTVFLPHELNLQTLHALDFEKGCYTGQEIIARMHYKGKLKKHMYKARISSETPPLPGADIYSLQNNTLQTSGIIVDICSEKHNDYHALIVTDEAHAKNQHLMLKPDEGFFTIEN